MDLSGSLSASGYRIPQESITADRAVQRVQQELGQDITPALNLAGFATTSMEPEAEALMMGHMTKNITHVEAYPAANAIERRCINMIARLFHAPLDSNDAPAVGVSSLGSSEAIMLSVLAAKYRWRIAREAADKSASRPNMVLGAAVHVCWKKAAVYFDIEPRYCASTVQQTMDPHEAVSLVDENTILVCAIMGTTYLGNYEDVELLNDLLLERNARLGLDVAIHVDAAAGGFVVPFTRPELRWDFRLPAVCSINVSGHKCTLTYAAVGWGIWRSRQYLPEQLLFYFDYCGSQQMSFTLNFSKSSAHVLGQYYQLLTHRIGMEGYRTIMNRLTTVADSLGKAIVAIGSGSRFLLLSKTGGDGLPIVVWRLKHQESYDEHDISRELRIRGLFVPAYSMTTKTGQIKLLRIVVRTDLSSTTQQNFLSDLQEVVQEFDSRSTNYKA
ncbi:glutamate decarboxylase [Coniochaeta ligniaria NRRL 30616]|uniref:Glutamate decarboxylase n=1 Tax=Coniochaeta ligniaria NRRL 30616 TaxID=1408157 RepID=A0A1J7INS2_9PEZI|nr:glutamate decarboxylase [Coniochaeta ligniaria NRRL 30616]